MVDEPQDQKKALSLYKAMNYFQRLPETRSMVDWLPAELKRLDAANRHEPEDVTLRQRQGACQVLEKILSMLAVSSEKADKLAQKQGG